MLKCNVCGCEFYGTNADHYTARDNGKTGLAAAFDSEIEPVLYDAFDCPVCGCQVIAQKRKRDFYALKPLDESEHSEENEDEAISDASYLDDEDVPDEQTDEEDEEENVDD